MIDKIIKESYAPDSMKKTKLFHLAQNDIYLFTTT